MGGGEAVARAMTSPEVDLVSELAGDVEGDLAGRLRQATWDLHREAERSGVVALMLSGGMGREAYGLFLRNLLAVYEALESGLDGARDHAAVGTVAREELYRGAALRADLAALGGADWAGRWPVLPEGRDYAAGIAAVAACDPLRLIAHAYVRYLGDLNGGRVLRRLVARALGLDAAGLAFYEFGGIADVAAFATSYRRGFETIDLPEAGCRAIIEEARQAFRHNIALSRAVAAFGA